MVIEPTVQPTAANDIVSLGIKLSSPFWIRELNSSYKGKGSNFTGMKGTNKLSNLFKSQFSQKQVLTVSFHLLYLEKYSNTSINFTR